MKPSAAILSAALLLIQCIHGFAQGFVNLNFESTTLTGILVNQYSGYYATNATVPGWTWSPLGTFGNGDPNTTVAFNNVALDAPYVTLHGTNDPYGYQAIRGKYSILLQSGSKYSPGSSQIGQTGQIPASAQSLTYWGANWNSLQITFGGQLLAFFTLSNTPNYTIYGADISPYAGQTGELLFTAPTFVYYLNGYGPIGGGGMIDNIQFSTTPIPEPGTLALAALGTLLLGCRRWRNSSR